LITHHAVTLVLWDGTCTLSDLQARKHGHPSNFVMGSSVLLHIGDDEVGASLRLATIVHCAAGCDSIGTIADDACMVQV
jgi:hypothetical protein